MDITYSDDVMVFDVDHNVGMEYDDYESDDECIVIDRDEEDRTVLNFQKTGNVELLDEVYKNRIPTLKKWARDNYYPSLSLSVDDLFGDLTKVFVVAAQKYDKKRGAFNTCLWTFLANRIKNIKNGTHAKKRTSEEYSGPLSGMVLSLDYPYGNKDGGEITLKDIIANKQHFIGGNHGSFSGMHFNDTLNMLSKDNPVVKDFLVKVSSGSSVMALIKEMKTQSKEVRISPKQYKEHNYAPDQDQFVKDLITKREKIKDSFKLIGYEILGKSRIAYTIELRATEESSVVMKAIRNFKRNREDYVARIKGIKSH